MSDQEGIGTLRFTIVLFIDRQNIYIYMYREREDQLLIGHIIDIASNIERERDGERWREREKEMERERVEEETIILHLPVLARGELSNVT